MLTARQTIFSSQAANCRIAVLIDPEKTPEEDASERARLVQAAGASCILLGGTHLRERAVASFVPAIRRTCTLPLILFPGASHPIHSLAPGPDGFLCPIVYTTRDQWFLTGWHIEAAPLVVEYGLLSIPMGYILVGDSSTRTSAVAATQSQPVAFTDHQSAIVLAQAAVMMGMSLVYLDAGSGAEKAIPEGMVRAVRDGLSVPLIVGGGVRNADTVAICAAAGADWVVVGNALETPFDVRLLHSMVAAAKDKRFTNSL